MPANFLGLTKPYNFVELLLVAEHLVESSEFVVGAMEISCIIRMDFSNQSSTSDESS